MASQITMAASRRRRSGNFPEDILREILSRLPVKTLLRFKCVSKQWHSIVSDPNFKLVTQDEDQRLAIVISHSEIPDMEYHSITDEAVLSVKKLYPDRTTCYHTINKRNSGGSTFNNDRDRTRLLGSCKGLVLISLDEHIFLWNPSTRCCRKVLELRALANPKREVVASGLFYDSSIDDYKAIVLIDNKEFISFASLKTKKWQSMKTPYSPYSDPWFSRQGCYWFLRGGPVVNERLHWLVAPGYRAFYPYHLPEKIACFASSSNKVEMLPMPEISKLGKRCALGVLDECLCLIRPTNILGRDFEVLVMKQYGKRESWTPMFNLKMDVGFLFWGPLFFTRGGEALLLPTWREIVAYDVKKQRGRNIHVRNSRSEVLIARTYVESLVSPILYEWNGDQKSEEKGSS